MQPLGEAYYKPIQGYYNGIVINRLSRLKTLILWTPLYININCHNLDTPLYQCHSEDQSETRLVEMGEEQFSFGDFTEETQKGMLSKSLLT